MSATEFGVLVAAADEAVAGVPLATSGAAAAELAGVAPEARIQPQKNLNTPHQPAASTPVLYLCVMEMTDSQEMHQDSEVPDKGLRTLLPSCTVRPHAFDWAVQRQWRW